MIFLWEQWFVWQLSATDCKRWAVAPLGYKLAKFWLSDIALVTPILIVFGDLSPKTVAFSHNQNMARAFSFPLLYFGKLISPLLWALRMISNFLQWLLQVKISGDAWSMLTHDEVAAAFVAGEAGGATSGHERELLERIMRFGQIEASDIMVPRTEIVGVDDNLTILQAYRKFRGIHFLPVYHQDLDDIWGDRLFPYWLNGEH